MFYCNDCADWFGYPSLPLDRRHGPCEMCGRVGICNDVGSGRLPKPQRNAAPPWCEDSPLKLNARQEAALRALVKLEDEARLQRPEHRRPCAYVRGFTADEIGRRAGWTGHRRHGSGAVKGSWSGMTAPGLSTSRTMAALVNRGLVVSWARHDVPRRVLDYLPTDGGRLTAKVLV